MKFDRHTNRGLRAGIVQGSLWVLCLALSGGCVPLDALPDDSEAPMTGGTPSKPSTHFEAEEAILFGAAKAQGEGAKGSGMVRLESAGDFVEFKVRVAEAGTYVFTARYANGAKTGAPLQVLVNSKMMQENLILAPTGAWEDWKAEEWRMPLDEGTNNVRLVARQDAKLNLDSLSLQKAKEDGDAGTPRDADAQGKQPEPDASPTKKMDADQPAPMDTRPPMPEEPRAPPSATPMCAGVDVFAKKCVACHTTDGIAPLDLSPAGLFDRLVSEKSVVGRCMGQDHVGLDAEGKPTGALMARLTGTSCGTRMPIGPALPKAELDCISDWIVANLKK